MITNRKYEKSDYKTVSSWWNERGWTVLPESSLPATGVIAEGPNGPIACAWLYKTDSDIALVEWMISSPTSTHMERAIAIPQVLEALTNEAKSSGYRCLFTWTNHASLQERFTQSGYQVADRDVQLLVKKVS